MYHRIDTETGMFIEDMPPDFPAPYKTETVMQDNWTLVDEVPVNNPIPVEQIVLDADGQPVLQDEYVEGDIPQGFAWPKRDKETSEWVEGGSPPEE